MTLQTLGLGFKLQFRVDAMPGVRKAPTAESLGSLPKRRCVPWLCPVGPNTPVGNLGSVFTGA